MMKTRTTMTVAIAASLLAWGGLNAIAAPAADAPADAVQAPAAQQRMHGRHMNPEQWQQRHAQRAEQLKQKLQLTDAQLPAWDTFQKAMQPPAHARLDRAELQKLSTPERIDRMRALREQRAAAADQRGAAVKTFYAALTPEQQKVFDAQGMHQRRERGMHGHGGMHQGSRGAPASSAS